MTQLFEKLEANNLIEGNEIICSRYPNGDKHIAVDKETFNSYFGDTDGTYTQLVEVGEPLGYKPFFDEWKKKKIIA